MGEKQIRTLTGIHGTSLFSLFLIRKRDARPDAERAQAPPPLLARKIVFFDSSRANRGATGLEKSCSVTSWKRLATVAKLEKHLNQKRNVVESDFKRPFGNSQELSFHGSGKGLLILLVLSYSQNKKLILRSIQNDAIEIKPSFEV